MTMTTESWVGSARAEARTGTAYAVNWPYSYYVAACFITAILYNRCYSSLFDI